MPSAKVADGFYTKNIQSICCKKSEEDKKCDVELSKKLCERKIELEDKLLLKLEELKLLCIAEGDITGILPDEIYKTLMPGEIEPKIKKRVGTSFKFSQDIFQSINTDNRFAQLEADIELHRKIVSAAEQLAKDKSTNKSVRKKRRKDWQAATQRLKSMEKGLSKMRLSNSKPDITGSFESSSMGRCNAGSGFSLNSLKGWSNFSGYPFRGTTKSCPTTPRGSIPDLSTGTKSSYFAEQKADNDLFKIPKSIRPVKKTSNASLNANLPPLIPNRRTTENSNGSVNNSFMDITDAGNVGGSYSDFPMYANIGYTSSVPYKSAYRQSNFPTIHNQNIPSTSSLNSYNTENFQNSNNCIKNSQTKFSIKKSSSSIFNSNFGTPSLTTVGNYQLSNIVKNMRIDEHSIPSSASIGSNSSTASSGYISAACISSTSTIPLMESLLIKQIPSHFTFSTNSLDRRSTRSRPNFINNNENNSRLNTSLSLNNSHQITTFPVNDICRPLEASDFTKFRSISAVHGQSNIKAQSKLGGNGSSISAGRLPLTKELQRLNNGTNSWCVNMPIDPKMEALLASIPNRKEKNTLNETEFATDIKQFIFSPQKPIKNLPKSATIV